MGTIVAEARKVENVLAKYEKLSENSMAVLLNSKKGLKAQAVFDFMLVSQFPNQVVEQLLKKTIKTFTSYKETNTVLDAVISEKLLKLFGLYQKGSLVFGSLDEFVKWTDMPAFGLGEQLPSSLLDTITGIELVREELIRIEYGDTA
ncbi:MAG: antitoxin Xre/MbcA/ParS toxin-binding domain-containing protein [Chitinophagaceae bacterium]